MTRSNAMDLRGRLLETEETLKRSSDVVGLHQYLAFCVFGGSIKG
jgi:hypothetical protein